MAKGKEFRDQVIVFNKETGKERPMGRIQFDTWGEHNGWALKPETEVVDEEPKTETGNDSEEPNNDTDVHGTASTSCGYNAEDSILKIKEMGEAGDTDGITAFIAGEADNKNRSSVLNAASKYLNA